MVLPAGLAQRCLVEEHSSRQVLVRRLEVPDDAGDNLARVGRLIDLQLNCDPGRINRVRRKNAPVSPLIHCSVRGL